MKRREVLAIISLGTSGFAGCVNRLEYLRTCDLPALEYKYLPDDAKEEVDIAFSEGQYATNGKLYYERLLEEPEEQALRKNNSYFSANITKEETGAIFGTSVVSTLSFEETVPTLDSPKIIDVENKSGNAITIDITIKYANGGVVTDTNGNEIKERTISLEDFGSGSSYEFEVLDKYTTYVVDIKFENGRTESDTFTCDRKSDLIEATIGKEEFSAGPIGAGYPTCPWEPNEA